MPTFLKRGIQIERYGRTRRGFGEARSEGPLDRVKFLAIGGGKRRQHAKRETQYPFHCTATFFAALRSSSASIFSLILLCANSDATRIAFLIALAFERPWQIMLTPRSEEHTSELQSHV